MIKFNRNKLLVVILILVSVVILVKLRREVSIKQGDSNINSIPAFISQDILGRIINSNILFGKFTYIQFMGRLDPEDIRLLESIYLNWKNDNLNIVLFYFNMNKIGPSINKIKTIVGDRAIIIPIDNSIIKLFRSNEYIGSYYIFDKAGKLIYHGNSKENYECNAKLILKQALRNEKFNIAKFINPEQNIYSSELFSNIAEIIKNENRDICVLSFFNKICDTCSGGQLIARFNEMSSLKGNNIFFLAVISDKYTNADIDRLRQQLEIKFHIILANGLLGQTWNKLINEYCDNELTDIVLVINKEGKIVKIVDRKCNCYQSLFDYLNKVI